MAVLDREVLNTEEFKEIFDKKFFNFCSKSPLTLVYKIHGETVLVYNVSVDPEASPWEFKLNYSLPVTENIALIKKVILVDYPTLDCSYYEDATLTNEEMLEEVKKGLTYEEAMNLFKTVKVKKIYRVEKRIDEYNEIIVRDLETGVQGLWWMRLPVSIFMKTLFENPKQGLALFKEKGKFKKFLQDVGQKD